MRAAGANFSEAFMKGIEPRRWLGRPRCCLKKGKRAWKRVEALDNHMQTFGRDFPSTFFDANEIQTEPLQSFGPYATHSDERFLVLPQEQAFHDGRGSAWRLRHDDGSYARPDQRTGRNLQGFEAAFAMTKKNQLIFFRNAPLNLQRNVASVLFRRRSGTIFCDEGIEPQGSESSAGRDEIAGHPISEKTSDEDDRRIAQSRSHLLVSMRWPLCRQTLKLMPN